MELVIDRPLEALLETIENITIKQMRIASPFITSKGMNETIIPYFQRKESKSAKVHFGRLLSITIEK